MYTVDFPDPKDYKKLVKLDHRCFKYDRLTESMIKQYKNTFHVFKTEGLKLIAVSDPQIIGFYFWEKQGRKAYLGSLDVDKKFRGQGWSRKMMKHYFEQTNDVDGHLLHVRSDNMVAINLYISLGYKFKKYCKSHYSDGGDAWIMEM